MAMKTYSILVSLGFSGVLVEGVQVQIKYSAEKPAVLYVAEYKNSAGGDAIASGPQHYEYRFDFSESLTWSNGVGGVGSFLRSVDISSADGWSTATLNQQMTNSPSEWPILVEGAFESEGVSTYQTYLSGPQYGPYTNYSTGPWTPLIVREHCSVNADVGKTQGWPNRMSGGDLNGAGTGHYHRNADATIKLRTGGRARPRLRNLFQINGAATEMLDRLAVPMGSIGNIVWVGPGGNPTPTRPIPPGDIQIDGVPLRDTGKMWRIYPDNTERDVTPRVKNRDLYVFDVDSEKYRSFFTIYVEQASPGYSFLPYGPNYVGHASWSFSTEAPIEALQYISTNYAAYLNHSWGFFPGLNGSICSSDAGQLEEDGANNGANIQRKFFVGFPDLLNGLAVTRAMHMTPPAYCVTGFNCVSAARYAGFASGVFALPWDMTPQNFGVMLIQMYPPVLSNDHFWDDADTFYSH